MAGGKHSSSGSAKKKASADKVEVHGYVKKDGTVVAPHKRSAPNKTQRDNWSATGNVNPETGATGSKEPTH
ncbi:MAG TPA: hypothetical protein VGO62_03105 [Myxococcota bacterium]